MAFIIEPKEDSPEKLAAVAGKPTKYYFSAPELMALIEYINGLALLSDLDDGTTQTSLASNFVTTSSTNADTNLSFAIGANEVWFVEFNLMLITEAITISLQISAPNGAIANGTAKLSSGFTTGFSPHVKAAYIDAVNTQLSPLEVVSDNNMAELKGFFRVKNGNNDGIISIGIASEAGGQNTTILAGSTIRANITTEV